MLEVAIKYADELKEKMYDIWLKDKYKYYNFCTYYQDIELDGETWNKHEFVSVSKKEGVIGFICYEVNRQANYCFTSYRFPSISRASSLNIPTTRPPYF